MHFCGVGDGSADDEIATALELDAFALDDKVTMEEEDARIELDTAITLELDTFALDDKLTIEDANGVELDKATDELTGTVVEDVSIEDETSATLFPEEAINKLELDSVAKLPVGA